ncbi:MAG: hypothetical protein IANPNBLG_03735 [Bryobacteraceae bacterium]|nr:hypothetical protein [Bryobacteraceae bacterium]
MDFVDSRNKIKSWQQALQPGARLVTGFFDPMIPEQVERLRRIAGDGKLVVLLKTPPNACLDPRARAELAASLDFVCAVVAETPADANVEALPAHEEEAPLRERFLSLVREKAAVKA